jgi:hypothetical protein
MFNVMMFHRVYGNNPPINPNQVGPPTGVERPPLPVRGRPTKKSRQQPGVPHQVVARDITESDNSTVTSAGTTYCTAYADLHLPTLPFTDEDGKLPGVPGFLEECFECPFRGERQSSWVVKKGSIRNVNGVSVYKSWKCRCPAPYVIRAFVDMSKYKAIQLQAPVVNGKPQLPHPQGNAVLEITEPTNPIRDGLDDEGTEVFERDILDFVNATYDEEPLLAPTSLWLRIRAHADLKKLVTNTDENFRLLVRLMKSLSFFRRNPTGGSVAEGICDNNSLLLYKIHNCITKTVPTNYVRVHPDTVVDFDHLCQLLNLESEKVYTLALPNAAQQHIQDQHAKGVIGAKERDEALGTLIVLRAAHIWTLCLYLKASVQNPNLQKVTLDCTVGLLADKASLLQISAVGFNSDPEKLYIRRQQSLPMITGLSFERKTIVAACHICLKDISERYFSVPYDVVTQISDKSKAVVNGYKAVFPSGISQPCRIHIYLWPQKNISMRGSITHVKTTKPRLSIFLHRMTSTCRTLVIRRRMFKLFTDACFDEETYDEAQLANYLIRNLGPDSPDWDTGLSRLDIDMVGVSPETQSHETCFRKIKGSEASNQPPLCRMNATLDGMVKRGLPAIMAEDHKRVCRRLQLNLMGGIRTIPLMKKPLDPILLCALALAEPRSDVKAYFQGKLIRLVTEFMAPLHIQSNEVNCFVCNGIPTLGRVINDERVEQMGGYLSTDTAPLDASTPGNQMRYLDMAQQGLFFVVQVSETVNPHLRNKMVDNPYNLYCHRCFEMQRKSYCFHVLLVSMHCKHIDPAELWGTTFASNPRPATKVKSHKVHQRSRFTGPRFRGIHQELSIPAGLFTGLDFLASRSIRDLQRLLKLQYRGIELNKFYISEQRLCKSSLLREIVAGTSLGEEIHSHGRVHGATEAANSFVARHMHKKSEIYPPSMQGDPYREEPVTGVYPPMYDNVDAFSCHAYKCDVIEGEDVDSVTYYLPTAMAIWNQTCGTVLDLEFRTQLVEYRDRLATLGVRPFGTTFYPMECQIKRVIESVLTASPPQQHVLASLQSLDLGFSPQGLMRDLKSSQELKTFMEETKFSKSRVSAVYLSPTSTSTILRTITGARQYEYHVLNTKHSIRLVVKDVYALFRLFHRMFLYEHSVDHEIYLKRSTLMRWHCLCEDSHPFGGQLGTPLPFYSLVDDEEELEGAIDDYVTKQDEDDSDENESGDDMDNREVINVDNGPIDGSENVNDLCNNVTKRNVIDLLHDTDSENDDDSDEDEDEEEKDPIWAVCAVVPKLSMIIIKLVNGKTGKDPTFGYAVISVKLSSLVMNPQHVKDPDQLVLCRLGFDFLVDVEPDEVAENNADMMRNDWAAKELPVGKRIKQKGVVFENKNYSVSSEYENFRYELSLKKSHISTTEKLMAEKGLQSRTMYDPWNNPTNTTNAENNEESTTAEEEVSKTNQEGEEAISQTHLEGQTNITEEEGNEEIHDATFRKSPNKSKKVNPKGDNATGGPQTKEASNEENKEETKTNRSDEDSKITMGKDNTMPNERTEDAPNEEDRQHPSKPTKETTEPKRFGGERHIEDEKGADMLNEETQDATVPETTKISVTDNTEGDDAARNPETKETSNKETKEATKTNGMEKDSNLQVEKSNGMPNKRSEDGPDATSNQQKKEGRIEKDDKASRTITIFDDWPDDDSDIQPTTTNKGRCIVEVKTTVEGDVKGETYADHKARNDTANIPTDTFDARRKTNIAKMYCVWDGQNNPTLPTKLWKEMKEELQSVHPFKLQDLMAEKDSVLTVCRIAKKETVEEWINYFEQAFNAKDDNKSNDKAKELRIFASRLCQSNPRAIFDQCIWQDSMLNSRQDTIAWTAARQLLGDVWMAGPPKPDNMETDKLEVKVTEKKKTKTANQEGGTIGTTNPKNMEERTEAKPREPTIGREKKKATKDDKEERNIHDLKSNKLDEDATENKATKQANQKEGKNRTTNQRKMKPATEGSPGKHTKKRVEKKAPNDEPEERKKPKITGDKKERSLIFNPRTESQAQVHVDTKAALAASWGQKFMITRMSPYFGRECERLHKINVPKPLMDVSGDGNCLFYCLLFHLFRTNKLAVDWKEKKPLRWMRKKIWEGLDTLTADDWMNSCHQTKEDRLETEKQRVFKKRQNYLIKCTPDDFGEPVDCLVFAKLFGVKVVIYNVCITNYVFTYTYDGRIKGGNVVVESVQCVATIPREEETLQIVNYYTNDPENTEEGSGSAHYAMVDWYCRACHKKNNHLKWFENRGCQSWCDNKVLCEDCARHVNSRGGKTFFCRKCQNWMNRWMVREECNEDCSNKQVCVECAEEMAPTAARRNTRSRSSNCTECKAPGNYLCVPVSTTENKNNVTYDCFSCKGNGKYELVG